MKLLNYLIICSFLSLLASCGDDPSFRLTEVGEGFSAVSDGEELPSEEETKKKHTQKCVDVESEEVSDEDVMTVLDYDANKLSDFTCDNGKVVFCHVPPGNADAAHYISIGDSENAIESHLNKIAEEDGELVYSYILRCDKYAGKTKHDDDDDDDDDEYEEESES